MEHHLYMSQYEKGHVVNLGYLIFYCHAIFQEEARLKKDVEDKERKEKAELEEATQRRVRQEEWVRLTIMRGSRVYLEMLHAPL